MEKLKIFIQDSGERKNLYEKKFTCSQRKCWISAHFTHQSYEFYLGVNAHGIWISMHQVTVGLIYKMSSNLKVFCFLRVIECIFSVICFAFHIFAVITIKDEVYPNEIIFRIFYFAFIPFSLFSALANNLNYHYEALSAVAGFIFYITASIYSMVVVEKDKHMENLTETEENWHPFFQMNRYQSVFTLVLAMVFLLHAIFSIELIINKPIELNATGVTRTSDDSNLIDNGALQLNFFPETIFCKIFKRRKN